MMKERKLSDLAKIDAGIPDPSVPEGNEGDGTALCVEQKKREALVPNADVMTGNIIRLALGAVKRYALGERRDLAARINRKYERKKGGGALGKSRTHKLRCGGREKRSDTSKLGKQATHRFALLDRSEREKLGKELDVFLESPLVGSAGDRKGESNVGIKIHASRKGSANAKQTFSRHEHVIGKANVNEGKRLAQKPEALELPVGRLKGATVTVADENDGGCATFNGVFYDLARYFRDRPLLKIRKSLLSEQGAAAVKQKQTKASLFGALTKIGFVIARAVARSLKRLLGTPSERSDKRKERGARASNPLDAHQLALGCGERGVKSPKLLYDAMGGRICVAKGDRIVEKHLDQLMRMKGARPHRKKLSAHRLPMSPMDIRFPCHRPLLSLIFRFRQLISV